MLIKYKHIHGMESFRVDFDFVTVTALIWIKSTGLMSKWILEEENLNKYKIYRFKSLNILVARNIIILKQYTPL